MPWLMMRQLRTASLSICDKVSPFTVDLGTTRCSPPKLVVWYRDAVQARVVKYRYNYRCWSICQIRCERVNTRYVIRLHGTDQFCCLKILNSNSRSRELLTTKAFNCRPQIVSMIEPHSGLSSLTCMPIGPIGCCVKPRSFLI